ncbi:hypothetical protein AAGS40_20805 [Paraburkholderia sp. PREW-6R]|uniref:hypothetical protein n=1 Tax=Paraburkholderia sp. PREW-6R TaxID=3141544 RepID=UPI0031F554F8
MSTQTLPGQSFPTPCKRCGGALYRQVDYCPYCGAGDPLDAGPHKRTVIPGSRASASATPRTTPNNPFDAPLADGAGFASREARAGDPAAVKAAPRPSALSTPGVSIPQSAESSVGLPVSLGPSARTTQLIRKSLFCAAAVVGVGLVLVGYALFRPDDETDSNANDQVSDIQDARTTAGTIAPYTPALAPNRQRQLNKAIVATPGTPATPTKAAPAIPVTPIMPLVAAAPVKPASAQFRDAGQAVQAARVAYRANNLSAAQSALAAAQTLQPDNADALSLSLELKPAIARRDAALQAAQACFTQQSWACARQHATDALSIDSGSDAASSMLERVITQTGWAPLHSPAATSVPSAAPLQTQALATVPAAAATLQAKPAPAQISPQTRLPQGPPAGNDTSAIAARPAQPALDPNSVEARERAIRESGWNRAAQNSAKPAAGSTASKQP